jgi:hypothetical protein
MSNRGLSAGELANNRISVLTVLSCHTVAWNFVKAANDKYPVRKDDASPHLSCTLNKWYQKERVGFMNRILISVDSSLWAHCTNPGSRLPSAMKCNKFISIIIILDCCTKKKIRM